MDPSTQAQMFKLLADILGELKNMNYRLNANIDEVVNRLGDVRNLLDR